MGTIIKLEIKRAIFIRFRTWPYAGDGADDAQALQKLREEKLAPIQTKLQNAIKNVGDRGKYVYIMDVSAGIPYISTTLSTDVTAEVKAELNKLK